MEEGKITCGICEDLLLSYCDGLLSDEVCEAVEHHLSECESCRGYLEELKKHLAEGDRIDKEKEKVFINKARTGNYYMIGLFIGALIPIGVLVIVVIKLILLSM